MKDIVLQLFDIGAIKFGSFVLKSGITSPIYIDLRDTISFPPLLKRISECIWNLVAEENFDLICGVPYSAIPMAAYLSTKYDVPLVMRRKEIKDYGSRKIIEGSFSQGASCLLLEDLITSGASIFETIEPLENAGIGISAIAVFLDRQQGGKKKIEEKGYRVYSVLTMTQMLEILTEGQRIDEHTKHSTLNFLFGSTQICTTAR